MLSGKKGSPTRDEKAENLVLNYSMILMSAFEDAFVKLASTMSEALVKRSEAMAEATGASLGGTPGGTARGKTKTEGLAGQARAKTSKSVKEAFAEMKAKARSEIPLDDGSLKEFMKAPAFDEGIKIVERYEFGLPKLTERLSDEEFVAYPALFNQSDPEFVKMSKELSEWQKSVPAPKRRR